jgi:segregation and condensation protein B
MAGEAVKRALDHRRNTPLTAAALEVLAIIAYNQPVSRGFIEQVRGVGSSTTVALLAEKGLIAEAGRLDLPGRPIAFRTTDAFLRAFGILSLSQLPPLHTGAELNGAELNGAELNGAELNEADLSGADLYRDRQDEAGFLFGK